MRSRLHTVACRRHGVALLATLCLLLWSLACTAQQIVNWTKEAELINLPRGGGTAVAGESGLLTVSFVDPVSKLGGVDVYQWQGVNNGYTWRARLLPEVQNTGDGFGTAVALDRTSDGADRIIVGAPGRRGSGAARLGAVFVFEAIPGSAWSRWRLAQTIAGLNADEEFGASVSVDAGRLVVGGPGYYQDTGYARLFEYANSSYAQTNLLFSDAGQPGDRFGHAVAIAMVDQGPAGMIAIGAPHAISSGSGAAAIRGGRAFAFLRGISGDWTRRPIDHPMAGVGDESDDEFGYAVDVMNRTSVSRPPRLVVGAPGAMGVVGWPPVGVPDSGAAFAYAINLGTLSLTPVKRVDSVQPMVGGRFGEAVAGSMLNSSVFIGAPGHFDGRGAIEASYIDWILGDEQLVVTSSHSLLQGSAEVDGVGRVLDAEGYVFYLGCSFCSAGFASSGGGFAVRTEPNGDHLTILGSHPALTQSGQSHFGRSIAYTGAMLAVGEPAAPGTSGLTTGAVRLYARFGSSWAPVAMFAPTQGQPVSGGGFGTDVAVTPTRLAAGFPGEHHASAAADGAGSVRVFEYASGAWRIRSTLREQSPGANRQFGKGVVFSPDQQQLLITGGNGGSTGNRIFTAERRILNTQNGPTPYWTIPAVPYNEDSGAHFGISHALDWTLGPDGTDYQWIGVGKSSIPGEVLSIYRVDTQVGSIRIRDVIQGVNPHFGRSVSAFEDVVAIGDTSYATASAANAGAVYLGNQVLTVPQANARMGEDVALNPYFLAAGAPGTRDSGLPGAVHLYPVDPGLLDVTVTTPRTIQPDNLAPMFGYAVALSHDRLAVGQPASFATNGPADQDRVIVYRLTTDGEPPPPPPPPPDPTEPYVFADGFEQP